jgi:hypothetical protein
VFTQKKGAEKGDIFMSYLYVKWNSFGLRFCSPTIPTLEHGLSCAGHSVAKTCDAGGGALRS